ncbi:hypothetical protein H4R19_000423 [Coemansia spiralis]|nr:hypothetical protein H4R19_000423 [Coemansia spiralis]
MKANRVVIEERDDDGELVDCQMLFSWQHNLDLIVGGGYQHFARHLVINDIKPADLLESLQLLQEIIDQSTIDWCRISGLYISHYSSSSESGTDVDSDDIQQVAAYAQQFVRCLPNVRKITSQYSLRATVYKAFIGKLYTHYGSQLRAFRAEYLCHPIGIHFGHQLASLVINGRCLKRIGEGAIYAPALKHLVIMQASYHRLPWAAFYDDGGSSSKTLAFQSLAHLELEYCYGNPQTDRSLNSTIPAFPKQLLFPKLQHMKVWGFLLNCPVMFHAQLPSRLWRTVLRCPVRVARALSSRTLLTALDISWEIMSDFVDKDSNPVNAVNALLGAFHATERLFVKYSVQEANFWADMEWRGITSLEISSPTTASDTFLILSKIPRVRSLILRCLRVSGLELDSVGETFNMQPGANPHDVSVRELRLFRRDREPSRYDYLRFMQILRSTFPGLRMVTVDN